MKNKLLITFSFISVLGFSQTNLVPNPTFEKVEKKIKTKGQIEVATPWISPTLSKADLYIPKSKNFDISIPENTYGMEKPMEGSGYAGILAYSYKGKESRSYLQVKLMRKLEAGKKYCVKYHVSLADLSKYAVNHLAATLTENAISANNSDVLKVESSIVSKRLTVYEQQYYWTDICGVYTSMGGEEYLTIGNFTEEAQLKMLKVKRPKGFNKPQKLNAYYFIDNVSVTPVEKAKKCDCDVVPGMENVEVVKSGFSSDQSVNITTVEIVNSDGSTGGAEKLNSKPSSSASIVDEDKVDGMKIVFDKNEFSISASIKKLDKVVAYLKENIDEKVIVAGYIDESEKAVPKLAGKRANTVYKYLLSKGVSKEQAIRKIEGADSPVDKSSPSKNMRVELKVVPL